jgi:3-methyladenine DNA glycosylase AlkC
LIEQTANCYFSRMEPLKEMFNKKFYQTLAVEFNKADKNFHPEKFVKDVTKDFEALSLNQRMRNTSIVLNKHLPHSYKKTVDLMKQVIPNLRNGYTSLVFPDYVSQFGLDDFDTSLEALKYFTSFGSSEFAIREFLKKDFDKAIKTMYKWAEDKNHHVRRLASEGSRPRLPWSFKLDRVLAEPKVTLPILEALKADDELYVRKSVANHLNDLSKDHTDYMLGIVNGWDINNPHTAWIIKHACRTLIKKGNAKSLQVFKFEKNVKVRLENFTINKKTFVLGDTLQFQFDLISEKSTPQKLVVDYCIHYTKKGGELSPKVFKLKEIDLPPKQQVSIAKKQLLKDFSTRTHHAGKHMVDVLVNGKVLHSAEFMLKV